MGTFKSWQSSIAANHQSVVSRSTGVPSRGSQGGSSAHGGGTLAAPDPIVSLTFVGSIVYPLDYFHLRRGLVGGSLSRAWVSVVQDSVRYVVSFRHEGSGADASAWETQLAGATHAYADLTAGAVTASAAAAAWVTALEGLGVTGIVADGANVTITGASSLLIGEPMIYDTATRGMWGMQRDEWGGSASANLAGNMGGTGMVHTITPGAGRILGVYIRSDGANDVRLGVGDGPAYSTTPASFTGVSEGVATNNGGLRLLLLPEPITMAAAADKWVFFKGAAAGNPTLMYRPHGEVTVGRGDLPVSENLVFDLTSDPAPTTAIATAGTYTPSNDANYAIYSFVGYIYEIADGGGSYPGDGGIVTQIGYHGDYTAGAHGTTAAIDMVDEAVGFRFPLPDWAGGEITSVSMAIEAWEAGEDVGIAIYDMGDLVYPSVTTNVLEADAGAMGTTGVGWQTLTLSSAVPFSSFADYCAIFFNMGELGVVNLDTLSANFDSDTGGTLSWLTAWEDDGRTWHDFMPAGGGGLGASAEYRTRGAVTGTLVYGDVTLPWPSTWVGGASDDGPRNLLRMRYGVEVPGINGSEA